MNLGRLHPGSNPLYLVATIFMPGSVLVIGKLIALLLALYGGLVGARFVLRVLGLLRAVIQFPRGRSVDECALPPAIRKTFDVPLRELQALGFELVGWLELQRALRTQHSGSLVALLRHQREPAGALVGFADTPEPSALFVHRFWTFFDDDTSLLTLNGAAHLIIGTLPRVRVVDRYLPRLDDQWRLHLEQLGLERSARPSRQSLPTDALQPAQLVAAVEAIEQEHIALLLQQRHLRRAPADEGYRMTLRGALAAAWRGFAAGGRAARVYRTARAAYDFAGLPLPEVPRSLEVDAYRRGEELRTAPLEPRYRWLLFGLTLVATAAASTLVFGPTVMLLIVATVLLHELGHYGAMRLFGYRDTSIFFIPFFGGAVTGRKPDARLFEELLVLFAGPLPGLTLATALLFAGVGNGRPLVADAIKILAFVNAFNLLPMLPLDGGRIVHALLFARQPIADALARLFAIAAFVWIGWRLHSLALALIGLAAASTIPYGFRVATLRKKFEVARARIPATAVEPAAAATNDDVELAFTTIQQWIRRPLAFAQKASLARALLARSQSTQHVDVVPALLWLALYGVTFLFGAGVTTRSLLR